MKFLVQSYSVNIAGDGSLSLAIVSKDHNVANLFNWRETEVRRRLDDIPLNFRIRTYFDDGREFVGSSVGAVDHIWRDAGFGKYVEPARQPSCWLRFLGDRLLVDVECEDIYLSRLLKSLGDFGASQDKKHIVGYFMSNFFLDGKTRFSDVDPQMSASLFLDHGLSVYCEKPPKFCVVFGATAQNDIGDFLA